MIPKAPARCLSLLLALPAVAGGREVFDLAAFEPPPGWKRSESPGQLTFDAPAGDGQVSLFASVTTTAPPVDNFTAEWTRLVTTPLGIPVPPSTVETSPDGWTNAVGMANVTAQESTAGIVQVTTTGFGRAMSIVAVFAEPRLADVTQFFDRLEFHAGNGAGNSTSEAPDAAAGASASPPGSATTVAIEPADVVDGRPLGLFYSLRVGTGGGARLEVETRTFFAGNRVTRMFPYGGGDAFDTARCIADSCGTYELSTGFLTVRWDDGRVDRWPLAVTAEGITLDGTLFRPARPVSAASLVGEWTSANSGGFANVYRFEGDGTFGFGAGGSMLHGHYDVEGLSLLLRFDDGDLRRRTLFTASRQEPVGMIAVEGEVYAHR